MTATIIFNKDLSGEVKVHTTKVEEIQNNQLTAITPPQVKANYASGPQDTILVNLLMIQQRFNVDGRIKFADRDSLRDVFENGDHVPMTYMFDNSDVAYNVILEKLAITQGPNDNPPPGTLVVKFTAIVGKNFGSA